LAVSLILLIVTGFQTAILALLMKYLGSKHSIMVGLAFEMLQLTLYGFGSQAWLVEKLFKVILS